MAKATLPSGFEDLANQRYIEAKRFSGNWKGTAREEYAFVSGDQWLVEDEQILRTEKRPPITFNYCEKMIDAVVGAEISSRQEVTYAPRDITDAPLAELWTNAAKWVHDQGNVEDEESDSFRDCLICGMGWTHTHVSYDEDPQGMLLTDRIDPLEMLWDPAARKGSLTDRRYSFRDMWVDERQARKQWPNSVLFSTVGTDDSGRGVDTVRQGRQYEDADTHEEADTHKDQVQIRHYECVELESYYRVATGDDGSGMMDVEADAFSKMKKELDSKNINYVRMNRKVYYNAYFSGESLLEGDKSPTQKGFTYGAITGKRDRNKNTWYGLIRVMKDPQRWANKWLSQILHIINSNAKGGLMAEANAFLDSKKAQEEWSKPNSVTLFKEGALSGNKVKEKTMTSYPSGLDRLMEFALSSLPQVTGINLEALGLASREQANVLEQSRKQAAYGLLAPLFNSLRTYRKNQGRVLLDLINTYISDGRLIRIGGPESQQFLPLTKAPGAMNYDIIVDQSPTAPDVKRDTWQALENLIPAAMKSGIPIPPTILKYAPIPTALALEWQQEAQTAQSRLSPEQGQQMQQQVQQLTQQNQQLTQQLRDKSAETQLKIQESQQEMQMKQQQMQNEHQLRMIELDQKYKLMQVELERTIELNFKKAQADVLLTQQKNESDAEIKRTAAKREPATSGA